MKKILIISLSFFVANLFSNTIQTFTLKPETNLVIQKGDITQCHVDVIVNAANEELLGGAGVCGAIFNAAGWDKLQAACNRYPASSSIRCPVGQARITDSFNLKSSGIKNIIHAVGPDCRIITDSIQQDSLLEASYKSSLFLAEKNNSKSIAFPFISSAIYAFPKQRAARIALKTVLEYIKNNNTKFSSVHFVLFSKEDYDLFCSEVKKLL